MIMTSRIILDICMPKEEGKVLRHALFVIWVSQ